MTEKPETVKNPRVGESWHRDCDLEPRYTSTEAVRGFWCAAHGQWTYEFPVSITYVYGDGTTYSRKLK